MLYRIEQRESPQYLRSLNVTPTQFWQHIVTKKLVVYLNHAIALSRMEMNDRANQYLQKAELLAAQYPEIAVNESGIMERIALFRKIGLPKSKKQVMLKKCIDTIKIR